MVGWVQLLRPEAPRGVIWPLKGALKKERRSESPRGPTALHGGERGKRTAGDLEKMKECEQEERKKLDKDLGLRAKGGDLAFEGSTEEGEEITGTKGGPTALHGGWKRIAGD